jgi:hypothetical protein
VAKRSNSSPAVTQGTKKNGPATKTAVGTKKYTPTGVANKSVGGAKNMTGGAQKAIGSSATSKSLPKPYPNNNVPYASKRSNSTTTNALPKPYASTPSFPRFEKKTAVKPGLPKPFQGGGGKTNGSGGGEEKTPYPGTNTLPGQGSRTPVKKYKAAARLAAPAEKGKAQHISV